jgi:predicted Zn-dependent protease
MPLPILSENEAQVILKKVMAFSKAESCEANLNGTRGGNARYARNTVTTSGTKSDTTLLVQSAFGKKVGTATVNEFDDASIERAVRRSEEVAKLAPPNPEYMPPLGPQTYQESKAAFESTSNITPDYRAEAAGKSLEACKANQLTAAGFLEDSSDFRSLMNSNGLFAYHPSTRIDFSVTVRTSDGTGSGYAVQDYNDADKLDTAKASQIAIEKALRSREAKAIEPGKYTVILEPAALVSSEDASLIGAMINSMNARNADEGRSFFSKAGGGSKLGEKIVDERITIYSDHTHPDIPASPWSNDGQPHEKTVWIENGFVKNLSYSRYWAEKKGKQSLPPPNGFIFKGGDATTEDLIKDTKKGILVTRLWYIRPVDRQTLLFTGLTRDGTFYIENGKIKHPIKNFRFNESPIIMLNNLEALGKPQRLAGSLIPPMKIRDFTFTSLSDAV